MANVRISQLPAAPAPIDGSELVPIVQNGQTVQTTVNDLISSPSLTQTFLTKVQEPSLPNSRYLGVGAGLGITDAGAQNLLQISPSGALASLVTSGTGIQVKTDATTLTNRSIATSGNGLSISNGSGVSGDPTLALSGLPATLANTVGTGLLAIGSSTTLTPVTITGTSDQISVSNGNGSGGNPTIGIASNPIIPGSAAMQIPSGTTGQRPSGINGQIRYNTTTGRFEFFDDGSWVNVGIGDGTISSVAGTANQIVVVNGSTAPVISIDPDPTIPGTAGMVVPVGTTAQRSVGPNGTFRYNTDTQTFEGYANGAWGAIVTGSGVTSIGTGVGLLGGPITSTGTIDIDTTVVATLSGIQTLTNKTISGASNTLTNIDNGSLVNSSVTYNGVTVALGGSGTITATATNALTIGTGLTGTSYNGSTAVTIAIDSTVATLSGTQALTNKTINGNLNTLSNIGNSSLVNSQITLGTTNIALGGTSLAPAGLTSVTVTQNPTSDFQLATKQYVDNLVATGTTYHDPVYVESPDTSGNLNATYNNGTAGVGATLTNAGTQVALTIDGVLMTVGKRVLIYNQTNQFENGVYTVTVVGDGSTNWVLTRATDADSYGPGPDALDQGSTFFVQAGTTGAGETYTCTTVGTITFGTTAITFSQIGATQVYSAGTGLSLTGTTFSIANTAVTAASYGSASSVATFTVNAQGQLTLAATTLISIAPSQINATIPNSGLTNSSITIGSTSVSLGGTISTLTGVSISGATNTLSNIGNSSLTNSSITINGSSVSLGGSITVTATASNALTIGTGLSGTSYDGSSPVTIAISNTGVVAASYGAASKTLTATVNAQGQLTALAETSIAIANTQVSGLGTMSTQNANSVAISGGNIDGTVIGGTTPAAITGTTITASNYVGVSGGTF